MESKGMFEKNLRVAKTKAQAEADVKVIEAQAEAEANRIIAESITPELIQIGSPSRGLTPWWCRRIDRQIMGRCL